MGKTEDAKENEAFRFEVVRDDEKGERGKASKGNADGRKN